MLTYGASVAVFALLAAGCGGSSSPRVASIGGAETNASTGKRTWAAYYHCFAVHGYPDYRLVGSTFPGGPADQGWSNLGNGRFAVSPGYVRKYSTPRFVAVMKGCDAIWPGKTETPAQVAAHVAQARKVAHCMRAHGMPDLPDPDSSGLIHVGSATEYSSPKFESAEGACQSLMTHGLPFLVHLG